MDPVAVGVSIALEAHRRGWMDTEGLSAVLAYYDGEGALRPPPPPQVLARLAGLPEARGLELLDASGLPGAGRAFSARLTVHDTLGRGGMGVVYKAFDKVLRRVVALKVLDLSQVADERRRVLLGRFEREARVMARLRHPAIAPLHDVGVDPSGNPFLVMELVPGKNLETLIDSGAPLEAGRVLGWGATAAQALHACHTAGVVHRDVKPSNVIITPTGEARLIDFGVARDEQSITRLTAENAAVGTMLYMAPEQVRGEECTARSDVYALGATLFHALAGRPPFEAPNAPLLLQALVNDAPPRLRALRPDLPRAVERLVASCLEKDPDARPRDASALGLELARLASHRGGPGVRPVALAAALGLAGLALVGALTLGAPRVDEGGEGPRGGSDRRPPQQVAAEPAPASPPEPARRADGLPEPLPPGLSPGERPNEFVNAKDGSVLVFVPAGDFLMGHQEDAERSTEELRLAVRWNDRPAHRVRLSGYFIGKYEVTWAQFRRFADANPAFAQRPDAHVISGIAGREFRANPEHPVFRVTWEQARAYCEWAGLRLPTEAEWEYAARGARAGQLYPWGDEISPDHANVFGDADGHATPTPVGSFPRDRSPFGCFDMCGNVHEWVWDLYGAYGVAEAIDPRGPDEFTQFWTVLEGWRQALPNEGPLRVNRGAAWTTWNGRPPPVGDAQVTRRHAGHPTRAAFHVNGFRVGRSR